jgi:hypothetical protein
MSATIAPIKNRTLPPLLRLLTHAVEIVQANDLEAALPVARRLLAGIAPHVIDDTDPSSDEPNRILEAFVREQAQRTEMYARAYAFMRSNEFQNASGGSVDPAEVFNAYTEPSVALGVAIAYVLLTDRGDETGAEPDPRLPASARRFGLRAFAGVKGAQ